MLKASDFVMDGVVVGAGKPYLTALIVLDEETVSHYAQTHAVAFSSFADLSGRPPDPLRRSEAKGGLRKIPEPYALCSPVSGRGPSINLLSLGPLPVRRSRRHLAEHGSRAVFRR